MPKKQKLLLDPNLDGKPRIGDSLLFVGRNTTFNSDVYQADIYESALKKYMVGKDLKIKLAHIIQMVNEKGFNIEVIQKSSKGQNFNNFIRADQKNNNKSNIPNVAFIVRVGDIEESLVPANTVILTVSFERDFRTVNGTLHPHFKEVLSGIQLTKLPESRYGHRSAISLDKLEIVTEFETSETQLKQRDFSSIAGLQKAFDMYSPVKSKIQLKEQSHFIQKFSDFLKSKEENKLVPYIISDEESVKLEEEKDYSLYTIHKGTQSIEPKDRFYIGSNKDYSSKIGVFVRKVEKVDYSEIISDQADEQANFKERTLESIKNCKSNIVKESKNIEALNKDSIVAEQNVSKAVAEANETGQTLALAKVELSSMKKEEKRQEALVKVNKDDLNKKLSVRNNSISSIDKCKKDIEKSLAKIVKMKSKKDKDDKSKSKTKDNITKLESNIKELKSIIADNKSIISGLEDKIKVAEEIVKNNGIGLKEYQDIVKASATKLIGIERTRNEQLGVVNEKETALKEVVSEIRGANSKIENLNSAIESYKQDIISSDKKVDVLKANLISFSLEGQQLVKLKVSVVSSKKEKSLQASLNVETSSFKDIAFRYLKDAYFSDYDAGLNMKFKRFLYTIRAYESGSYKSPYAALSLEKPDVAINVDHDVKSPSIKLNQFQQQALNATANSHFASFLQGPPGTGKTQVIASAIENEILNGGNVLISSSTNAAINNAMERMNRIKSNPNVFFLRHSNNIDKIKEAQAFTSQMLYQNFIERLDGFVNANSSEEQIDLEPIKLMVGEGFTRRYVPDTYFDNFISQIKDIDEMEYFIERFDAVEVADVTLAKNEIKEILEYNRRSSMKAKAKRLDDYVSTNSNRVRFEQEDDFNSYLAKLQSFTADDSAGGEFNKRLKNLSKKFTKDSVSEEKSKEFASYLFDNSYINVIGITTTSQLAIKQTGGKKTRELFVDYPINFAIIDEISKSVTPEILSVAKLADRFMFAGDYRQLPPTSEISPKLIEEFRHYCIENSNIGINVDQTMVAFGVNNSEEFLNSINDLLAVSLFTNQVNDMKRSKKAATSYTALKTQYRFSSVINELVNLTYDSDEALTPGKIDSEFNKYEMGIKNLSSASVSIVDTSFISADYAKKLNDANATKLSVVSGQEAFDHNDEIFYKRAPFNSKINEYNSYVIVNIIENLMERNKKSFDPLKVGIIAMTRSQAQVIKKELSRNEKTKAISQSIKVDTVDNFQGQEKDIIVLDLVRAKGKLEGSKIIYGNRNLDFYKKPERINVAVSRAQSKLVVVGAINDYLGPEVISDVFINGSSESINLFEEWKDIIGAKGDVTSWEKF